MFSPPAVVSCWGSFLPGAHPGQHTHTSAWAGGRGGLPGVVGEVVPFIGKLGKPKRPLKSGTAP